MTWKHRWVSTNSESAGDFHSAGIMPVIVIRLLGVKGDQEKSTSWLHGDAFQAFYAECPEKALGVGLKAEGFRRRRVTSSPKPLAQCQSRVPVVARGGPLRP